MVTAAAATAGKFTRDEAEDWLRVADADVRRRITSTWAAALAADGELAEDFYARVFDAEPAAIDLFPGDMTEQKKLLTKSMTMAIELVDRPEELLLLLQASGARHAHYGVTPPQFNVIGRALIETVAERAGDAFSDADRVAWQTFYAAIAAIMKAGMRRALRA